MKWTPEKDAAMRAAWGTKKPAVIAASVGATEQQARNRAYIIGLRIREGNPQGKVSVRTIAHLVAMRDAGHTSPDRALPTSDLLSFLGLTDAVSFHKAAKRWRTTGLLARTRQKYRDQYAWYLTEKGEAAIHNPRIIAQPIPARPFVPPVVKPRRRAEKWTKSQDSLLRIKWGAVSLETIAENLDRSETSVAARAYHLGLRRPSQGRVSITDFRAMGYAYDRVKNAIAILGIKVEPTPRCSARSRRTRAQRRLTDEQAEQVLAFLRTVPDALPLRKTGIVYPASEWGVGGRPPACVTHGGTDIEHQANGQCVRCYKTAWARKKREKAA